MSSNTFIQKQYHQTAHSKGHLQIQKLFWNNVSSSTEGSASSEVWFCFDLVSTCLVCCWSVMKDTFFLVFVPFHFQHISKLLQICRKGSCLAVGKWFSTSLSLTESTSLRLLFIVLTSHHSNMSHLTLPGPLRFTPNVFVLRRMEIRATVRRVHGVTELAPPHQHSPDRSLQSLRRLLIVLTNKVSQGIGMGRPLLLLGVNLSLRRYSARWSL